MDMMCVMCMSSLRAKARKKPAIKKLNPERKPADKRCRYSSLELNSVTYRD